MTKQYDLTYLIVLAEIANS
jgi:hypothetical protein